MNRLFWGNGTENSDSKEHNIQIAVKKLFQKAEEHGLVVSEVESSISENVYYEVSVRAGKTTRNVNVLPEEVQDFLNSDFERWDFIGDYEAIADLEKGIIEAVVTSRDIPSISFVAQRLGWDAPFFLDTLCFEFILEFDRRQ